MLLQDPRGESGVRFYFCSCCTFSHWGFCCVCEEQQLCAVSSLWFDLKLIWRRLHVQTLPGLWMNWNVVCIPAAAFPFSSCSAVTLLRFNRAFVPQAHKSLCHVLQPPSHNWGPWRRHDAILRILVILCYLFISLFFGNKTEADW